MPSVPRTPDPDHEPADVDDRDVPLDDPRRPDPPIDDDHRDPAVRERGGDAADAPPDPDREADPAGP